MVKIARGRFEGKARSIHHAVDLRVSAMSSTDPIGEGGGGGGGGGGATTTTTTTNVEQTASPSTPITGTAVPAQPATQQQQHPPPSPLSGCYLLVVLPEPHTAQHKDLILNRLAKGKCLRALREKERVRGRRETSACLSPVRPIGRPVCYNRVSYRSAASIDPLGST